MDQTDPHDQTQAAGPDAPPAPDAAAPPPPPEDAAPPAGVPARGAGRRILAAVVLLPWVIGYGSVGAWAVTFGARSLAAGNAIVDAGYTRMVTPGGVILVGALLLAAFVTVMAAGLLLIYDSRRRGLWGGVAVAAAVLTAGAVWAGVRGELVAILWILFFFGIVYALAVALWRLWRGRRGKSVLRP